MTFVTKRTWSTKHLKDVLYCIKVSRRTHIVHNLPKPRFWNIVESMSPEATAASKQTSTRDTGTFTHQSESLPVGKKENHLRDWQIHEKDG